MCVLMEKQQNKVIKENSMSKFSKEQNKYLHL